MESVKWLTLRQAASYANVHLATVRRWVDKGKLKKAQHGAIVRIDKADLERFMRSGK